MQVHTEWDMFNYSFVNLVSRGCFVRKLTQTSTFLLCRMQFQEMPVWDQLIQAAFSSGRWVTAHTHSVYNVKKMRRNPAELCSTNITQHASITVDLTTMKRCWRSALIVTATTSVVVWLFLLSSSHSLHTDKIKCTHAPEIWSQVVSWVKAMYQLDLDKLSR